jgi:predicted nuclease with TOPRIM domain
MPSDFEQLLRDIFGDSVDRLTNFQREQAKRLQGKLQELAREALHEELGKLNSEVAELRARVAVLENERIERSAESV